MRIGADTVALMQEDGPFPADATQAPVDALPDEAIGFLLASRYADFDRLLWVAWNQFGELRPGAERVKAICAFAGSLAQAVDGGGRTAFEVMEAGRAGEEDRTHVAIALCRALNIPARYCSGYLADGGADRFDCWLEVWLDGRWHAVDAETRHRGPRLLVARGRDSLDVAPMTIHGAGVVRSLRVWTGEISARAVA